jgi:DNA-binding PadR family transcriptional regulator
VTSDVGSRPLNPTAASLLGFLHDGPLSGYELVGAAEAFLGPFWSLTRSQVYRELATLAARGLVEEGEVGARSRRPFRITESGRVAFRAWIEQPPGEESIRYPLLLTMSFGSFLGVQPILDVVAAHRQAHQERLASYQDADPSPDRFLRAVQSFGVHYERAVLAWMDELPQILES